MTTPYREPCPPPPRDALRDACDDLIAAAREHGRVVARVRASTEALRAGAERLRASAADSLTVTDRMAAERDARDE